MTARACACPPIYFGGRHSMVVLLGSAITSPWDAPVSRSRRLLINVPLAHPPARPHICYPIPALELAIIVMPSKNDAGIWPRWYWLCCCCCCWKLLLALLIIPSLLRDMHDIGSGSQQPKINSHNNCAVPRQFSCVWYLRERAKRQWTVMDLIKKRKLKLFGHICRMGDRRLIKTDSREESLASTAHMGHELMMMMTITCWLWSPIPVLTRLSVAELYWRDNAINTTGAPPLHLTTSKVMVIVWRLRGNIIRTAVWQARHSRSRLFPVPKCMG